jgi:hypothetical protein
MERLAEQVVNGDKALRAWRRSRNYLPLIWVYSYRLWAEHNEREPYRATARISLGVGGEEASLFVSDGDSDVQALDAAIRKGVQGKFPYIDKIAMSDFSARVAPDSTSVATPATVWVTQSDGHLTWVTSHCHSSLTHATLLALIDSYRFYFLRRLVGPHAESSTRRWRSSRSLPR